MGNISDHGREQAQAGYWTRLLPVVDVDDESWQDISSSVAFGPFEPGDFVEIASDVPVHVIAGDDGTAATETCPQLPAGVHGFTVPSITGLQGIYVHLLGVAGGNAANGAVWKSS